MSKRDTYHETVKHALIEDGWTITHEASRPNVRANGMASDLSAICLIWAENGTQKILVEIKHCPGDYPALIKRILTEYAANYSKDSDCPLRTIFDDYRQAYLLLDMGWEGNTYIHKTVIHIDIIDGAIWIQHDDTEEGVATDLLDAGVPHQDIVLGFRSPELRPYTEFGIGKSSEQHAAQSSVRAA